VTPGPGKLGLDKALWPPWTAALPWVIDPPASEPSCPAPVPSSMLASRQNLDPNARKVTSPDLAWLRARLLAGLCEGLVRLPLSQSTGFASLTLALPNLPGPVPALSEPHFLFSHADRGELRAGYGCAGEWQAAGPERLTDLRNQALRLKSDWHQCDPDATGLTGFTLCGFAAAPGSLGDWPDPFPDAVLWLPELALHRLRGRSALTLTTPLPADRQATLARWGVWLDRLLPRLYYPLDRGLRQRATPLIRWNGAPEPDGWARAVDTALDAIAEGRLDKVVLSRRVQVQGPRGFDLERLAESLDWLFPSCQVVRVQRDGHSLVAATPERLLARYGDRVHVDAIAGTAARAVAGGRDAALCEAMVGSRKELHEHALVVEALRAALAPYSRHLEVPDRPQVMRLHNAQHLWTPIHAKVRPGLDTLRLADLLHPTPATHGAPREAAGNWLRQAEPAGRGWYTGAAGWLDPDLDGELWVLLRCAQIREDRALLHAGAGIVAGSNPQAEWCETEAKLAAMLTALQYA
jgi:salicylate biosynthesis isochorismate synthase